MNKAATLIIALVFVLAHGAFAADFYVAPSGNDTWPGAEDKPFATLERARDAIRQMNRRPGGIREPVAVYLRDGRYQLAQPLTFTFEDSGTEGRPITYCAYPGEKPVISGGVQIRGWARHDDRLWVAEAPWARKRERPLCQLFVNGVRRTRARTPNEGSYFYTQRLILKADAFPVCLGFIAQEGDNPPLPSGGDAVVCLFHNWVNSFDYVKEADRERRRFTFARPAGIFFLGPRVRYYVENTREGLDAPGAWYLDAAEGKLYYHPAPGEDMTKAEVIAPAVTAPLVEILGDPEMGILVEYLTFRGLSFQHADADLSRTYRHGAQGAPNQKGAILAKGLCHSVIEDCEFTRLGEHAVSLWEGCAENTITRCHVHDVGGGGIYLSEDHPPRDLDPNLMTTHNKVDNNFIHDGGYIFRQGVGVFLGGSATYNQITHNEICDMSWIGVHLGWSWTGQAPAYTHHNEVAFNHIHHLGNGVLNDMGGIYTLGVSPGTVLHHNLIHDVTRYERGKLGYGGWGIYLDAGSSEIRVENNVVYNTRDGGFHAHCDGYPYGDVIVNNIFACSADAQMIRNNNKEPDGSHLHLERNIVYNHNDKMFGGSNWKEGGRFTLDRNLYWSETTHAPDFCGKDFAAWQKGGRDTNSLIADPRFVDAQRHDFGLRPDSPALKLGFQPIDLSRVGLYGPDTWTRPPRTITHRAIEKAPPEEPAGPIVADFEEYEVGEQPEGAVAREGGAYVAVTDQGPASGRRCLRFVDAAGVTVWKPHWCVWRTPGAGKVRLQCSVKNDPAQPATFDLEFRDWDRANAGPAYFTGPHLRFLPDGTVQAAGRAGQSAWTPAGKYSLGRWVRVEIEFEEGDAKPKTYALRLTERDGAATVRSGLPFRSEKFSRCTWFGFSGAVARPAVFYLDDFQLE